MKVSELKSLLHDKIVLYKETQDNEFEDVFVGKSSDIPKELLDKDIKSIGAKRKGIVDIKILG